MMIMVIWLMVIALLFGLAVALVNLDSSSTTTRDARQSRAQQAADAGVEAMMYQQGESTPNTSTFNLNGGLLGTGTFLDCVEPVLNSALQITSLTPVSASGGTCPASSGASGTATTPVGDHAYYQSLFFPGASTVLSGASDVELQPRIVSLGIDKENSNTVYSREEAILYPIEPLPVIGGNNNTTVTGVSLSGGLLSGLLGKLGSIATVINGDIEAANDVGLPSVDAGLNLTLSNGLQGVVQYGNQLCNSTSTGSLTCPASPTPITTADLLHQAPPVLRPITLPSASVMPDCPSTNVNCASFGSDYNSTTDTLTVPTGTNLVISPGTYVLCNVVEQGTGGITAEPSSSVPVEIFIDNPNSARCSGNGTPTLSSGTNSVTGHVEYNFGNFVAPNGVSNGAGNVTGVLGASGLQIYVVGDQPTASNPYDDDTYVQIGTPGYTGTNGGLLSSNLATEEAVVYAPTSEVSLTTAQSVNLGILLGSINVPGVFDGNLIGDDVTVAALTLTQDLDLGNFALYNDISLYHVNKYVGCDSSVTSLSSSTTQAQATSGC